MKAIFKNKIFLASAATVLVAVIAVTSILLLPKTEAVDNGNESTPAGDTSSAAPAGLDVAEPDASGAAQTEEDATLPPEANEPEQTIPVDEQNPDEQNPATAKPGKVEAGSKDKPENPAVPGVDDNPPPPNNIDEIPDAEPDDTPGNTEGGGEPGDGVKF